YATVTGVETCALPIYERSAVLLAHQPERLARAEERSIDMDGEHPAPRLVGEVLGDVEVGLGTLTAQKLHDDRFGLAADLEAIVTRAEGDPGVVDEDVDRAQLAL